LSACASSPNSGGRVVESDNRESARIHAELASGYYVQNLMAVALEEFTESARQDPSYAPAYSGLGLVNNAIGEYEKADEHFKRALQLEPNNSDIHNNYGSFLCGQRKYNESIPHFLFAVKNPLYSTPELAYQNAGVCSAKNNDTANAQLYLTKALQINSQLNQAAYQLALLQYADKQYALAKNTLQNALSARASAEMLWLGLRIERALGSRGDRDAESSYALQLKKQYPNSEQAKKLLSGE
jgi:type IV pilus assembly protein PilF